MRCERCHANISGKQKRCPLCQNELVQDGNDVESVFPIIKLRTKRTKFIVNIVTLVLFSAAVICVLINLVVSTKVFWSLFVVAGAACLWAVFVLTLKARRHIPKAIFWVILLIAVLAVLWDFATGYRGWSISFVVPIIFTGAIVMIRVVANFLKLSLYDYIIYAISTGVLGIIPLIFLLTNILSTPIPSAICIGFGAISLGILFTFDRSEFLEELKRRTHIG